MTVLVLKDPDNWRRRNQDAVAKGGFVVSEVSHDGDRMHGYREVDGVRISTDDEWMEVEDDAAAMAHYARFESIWRG